MVSLATHNFGILFLLFCLLFSSSNAQLSPYYYARTCPRLENIVRVSMVGILRQEPRMGASILRLFFHDCFVNGCDASVLLDDTPNFQGEKNAGPNANSLRGFEAIDTIKLNVETMCSNISCADILALAARDAVNLLGGPTWRVRLGRRDTRGASVDDANTNLIPPTSNISTLISGFSANNLTARDMTALSGAHTLGQAQCSSFRDRVYNESNVDYRFASRQQSRCPDSGGDNNLAPLDITPNRFDNVFFRQLMVRQGLLHSDQELFNGGPTDGLVRLYARSNYAFFRDFRVAMVKLGNLNPLTGPLNGEIRRNCRLVN